jgi:hypothetical protein
MEYESFKKFADNFEKHLPDISMMAAIPALEDAGDFLLGVIPEYPPKLPDSRYERTGNLSRAAGRDEPKEENDGVLLVLGYDKQVAPYAPWVVGPDFQGEKIGERVKYQARIHVDRWWQFADVIDENIEDAWQKFDEIFWKKFNEYLSKGN